MPTTPSNPVPIADTALATDAELREGIRICRAKYRRRRNDPPIPGVSEFERDTMNKLHRVMADFYRLELDFRAWLDTHPDWDGQGFEWFRPHIKRTNR
jgi:hypothetical protein